MKKFKFITSCLLVMVMGLSFVSCEEMSEVIGYERSFDSYFELKVVSCERIGANLRVDFTLKNKTGKMQQEVTFGSYDWEGSKDNLGNQYWANIAIDDGPWKEYSQTFPMSKDETISGSFLFKNFDPTNTAETFNWVYLAEWTTHEGICIGRTNKIKIVDNRVLENGFQTNDKKLEYKHVKSFIDENDNNKAYVTFTLKNKTGKNLTGLRLEPYKLTDNQGGSNYYTMGIFAGNNYSNYNGNYSLSNISLNAEETMTFTIYTPQYPNPNATKFSGEIEVSATNYNMSDNMARFFTVPVTSK